MTELPISNPVLLAKRDEILQAVRENGGANLRVFGSVARGEEGPNSDFDFLVDGGPQRPPFFPGGLQIALQELLGRKVDLLTEGALHPRIRERVLNEAIPL